MLVLGLALALPAGAAEVADLYAAEVPASGRDAQAQGDAVSRALVRVLVKVTGKRNPAANAAVAEALPGAGRFVEQFRFRSVTVPGPGDDLPEVEETRLWASFDPRVVDGLARDAGLPVWGRVRPSVVLWLGLEGDGERALVGSDVAGGAGDSARAAAAMRGLPLQLPLLDLEDRARVAVMDVWGGFGDKLVDASARYQADAVLVARVFPVSGSLWEGRWLLSGGSMTDRWTVSGASPEELIEEGVNEAADRIASRFSGQQMIAGPAQVPVIVDGVDTFAGYARVMNYLQALDGVDAVEVEGVNGATLRLGVHAAAGGESLLQVVRLGRILGEFADAGVAGGLHFRLLP